MKKENKNESVGCEFVRQKEKLFLRHVGENDTHKMHGETDNKEGKQWDGNTETIIIPFGIRESANETVNYLPFPSPAF